MVYAWMAVIKLHIGDRYTPDEKSFGMYMMIMSFRSWVFPPFKRLSSLITVILSLFLCVLIKRIIGNTCYILRIEPCTIACCWADEVWYKQWKVRFGCRDKFALGNSRGSSDFPKGHSPEESLMTWGSSRGKFVQTTTKDFIQFFLKTFWDKTGKNKSTRDALGWTLNILQKAKQPGPHCKLWQWHAKKLQGGALFWSTVPWKLEV